MDYDVCIIGGGAAGLAAAASLSKTLNICLVEKNEILGRKISVTGGGRCNITNAACEHKNASLDFFTSLGIETYCDEEGRYFPYSNRASDVVLALTRALGKNVNVKCGFKVISLKSGEMFEISDGKDSITAKKVILAVGGKAAPHMGTTGDGYALVGKLGHSVSRLYPILAGIECEGLDFDRLSGIRSKARVSLLYKVRPVISGGKEVSETGEVQFTSYGISGVCVFNLTPHMKTEEGIDVKEALSNYTISMDLAPDFEIGELVKRSSAFGIVTDSLAAEIDETGGPETMKDIRLSVTGIKGWRYAQCTAGGVSLEEIDCDTMESRLIPGLYVTGELLDIQGPCGGFNLQNAWETGLKAAAAINKEEILFEIQDRTDKT